MNHQTPISISKRTALSAALCLALGTGVAEAAPWSGTFTMIATDEIVGVYPTVIGTEKVDLASTSPFFGFNWTAKSLTTYGPGTYTIDTIEAGIYSFTVGSGQIAGHMLFDWSSTKNIDVINLWNVTTKADGTTTYESIDFDCGKGLSGMRGCGMIDGPFPMYHANFDMTAFSFSVATSVSQNSKTPILITLTDGNVTISTDKTVAGGYSFDWSASDATLLDDDITHGDGTSPTDGSSYRFTPAGGVSDLVAGTTYTAKANVTNPSSLTATITVTVTVAPATALTATDTDGDGINDNDATEGYWDNDGDGIPNYLDPTNDSAALVAVSSTDTSLGSMSASTGTVSLGATALSNSITNMLASTAASGLAVTTSDIGTTDGDVNTSCVGGCFDFKVTGLSDGGTSKVVIPLSTPLGDFPVYRKFADSKWTGFVIDDNNSISSAAALSTGPITCPAAGNSAYSRVGLTPGDSCIQLTMLDGGANDADTAADGVITDPGGVATTGEFVQVANVPNGCSMSTTPVNPTERADWWLVAGFLGALAWLRGMRRKGHAV